MLPFVFFAKLYVIIFFITEITRWQIMLICFVTNWIKLLSHLIKDDQLR